MEIWKPITEYEHLYEISNYGNVKTIKTGKLKKATLNNEYLRIQLSNGKKQQNIYIHKLVCQAFHNNPENKLQVNHKDCNKLNNCADNLEWCTQQENKDHAVLNNLSNSPKGEQHGSSKVTTTEVQQIRESFNNKVAIKELAKQYNISVRQVYNIVTKQNWKNVTI